MEDASWNNEVKRLLKSELVRRGINNDELVGLLRGIGVEETKASIDSKISRGTFSAAFLLQCLNAIGCKNLITEIQSFDIAAEPIGQYKRKTKSKSNKR